MSLETRTYADLLTQIKAKFGASGLSTSEEAMILPLVNARAFGAYQSSQNWPRYLVSNEPRSVNIRQVVARVEDGLNVQGAGKEEVNGIYERNGTYNGAPAYRLKQYSPSYYIRNDSVSFFIRPGGGKYLYAGTNIYSVRKNASNEWELVDGTGTDDASATVLYKTPASNFPYGNEWAVFDGADDAPIVFDLSPISEYMRVHLTPSFVNSSGLEFNFHVTSEGAHLLNLHPVTSKVVYVTYKRDFSEFTASSTDIPREWFYFIAAAVYSDMLRMQNRNEQAQTEEALAQNYLNNETERVNNINNTTLLRKFSTHLSRQGR